MDSHEPAWPHGATPERFFQNLACLGGPETPIVERLCWPAAGDHVCHDADGGLVYTRHESTFRFEVDDSTAAALVEDALERAAGRPLCAIGIGAGELVRHALDQGATVVAWDRDPWLFRLALGRNDFRRALRSGKLSLALGIDLDRLAGRGLEPLPHPLFGAVYATEQRALDRGLGPRRALVCDGGLYVESLIRALEDEGWSVWPCDVEHLSFDEIRHTARALRPRLIASINDRDGLVEFARQHGARLLVWEIDPSTSHPGRVQGPTDHVRFFTYRKRNVAAYRRSGHAHVDYLPLAADTRLRQVLEPSAEERAQYGASVSFVGSSMVANAARCRTRFEVALERWRGSAPPVASGPSGPSGPSVPPGRAVAAAVLDEQRADETRCRLDELLDVHAPGFAAWCRSTDAEDPSVLLGEVAASERRLRWMRALGDLGLHVWGDDGWCRATDDGVVYRGPASHGHDLNRVYAASTINLDIGRLYQTDIVTLRVFDVLACGGFALVEHSDALAELFDVGRELDSYRTLDELRAKIEHYLAHPDEARAIAARGHAAVLARHAFGDRVRTMLASFERAGEAPVRPSEG